MFKATGSAVALVCLLVAVVYHAVGKLWEGNLIEAKTKSAHGRSSCVAETKIRF